MTPPDRGSYLVPDTDHARALLLNDPSTSTILQPIAKTAEEFAAIAIQGVIAAAANHGIWRGAATLVNWIESGDNGLIEHLMYEVHLAVERQLVKRVFSQPSNSYRSVPAIGVFFPFTEAATRPPQRPVSCRRIVQPSGVWTIYCEWAQTSQPEKLRSLVCWSAPMCRTRSQLRASMSAGAIPARRLGQVTHTGHFCGAIETA